MILCLDGCKSVTLPLLDERSAVMTPAFLSGNACSQCSHEEAKGTRGAHIIHIEEEEGGGELS